MITSKKRSKRNVIIAVIFSILMILSYMGNVKDIENEKHFYENAKKAKSAMIHKTGDVHRYGTNRYISVTFWIEDNECFADITPRYVNINTRKCSGGERVTVYYDENNPEIIAVGELPENNYYKTAIITKLVVVGGTLLLLFLRLIVRTGGANSNLLWDIKNRKKQ